MSVVRDLKQKMSHQVSEIELQGKFLAFTGHSYWTYYSLLLSFTAFTELRFFRIEEQSIDKKSTLPSL